MKSDDCPAGQTLMITRWRKPAIRRLLRAAGPPSYHKPPGRRARRAAVTISRGVGPGRAAPARRPQPSGMPVDSRLAAAPRTVSAKCSRVAAMPSPRGRRSRLSARGMPLGLSVDFWARRFRRASSPGESWHEVCSQLSYTTCQQAMLPIVRCDDGCRRLLGRPSERRVGHQYDAGLLRCHRSARATASRYGSNLSPAYRHLQCRLLLQHERCLMGLSFRLFSGDAPRACSDATAVIARQYSARPLLRRLRTAPHRQHEANTIDFSSRFSPLYRLHTGNAESPL